MTSLTTEQTEDIEIRVNNQLVRFNNLLTALEYLKEEISTREIDPNIILDNVKTVIGEGRFLFRVTKWLTTYYMPDVISHIKKEINEILKSFIEERINSLVDKKIKEMRTSSY